MAVALLAMSADASAFCRSTTCRSSADKECPTDDDECPTEGAKLSWPTRCLRYATNKLGTQELDPADTRDVIRRTFEAWSDVACPEGGQASMHFEEQDPVSCKKSQYNKTGPNVNVVLFQDDDWKYRGIDATLAKTSVTYNDETGEIYDADIEVNTANNTVTISDDPAKVKYDLQAILTHEVGHFIGVAHSSSPSAVMFASYSPGSTAQRKLDQDDVDAVCAVYPPESGIACQAEPRGGFEGSCDEPPESKAICSASPNKADRSFGFMGVLVSSALVTAARLRGRQQRSRRRR